MEDQHPSKKAKSEESNIVIQLKALIESNRQLASQIKTLTNITTHQVHSLAAQSVGFNQNCSQYDKGGYKKQDSNDKVKKNKPYLGKTQDPIPTKGKDGSLNITDTCNYCKNPGHILSNCKKLDNRIQRGLARPIHLTQKSSGKQIGSEVWIQNPALLKNRIHSSSQNLNIQKRISTVYFRQSVVTP